MTSESSSPFATNTSINISSIIAETRVNMYTVYQFNAKCLFHCKTKQQPILHTVS